MYKNAFIPGIPQYFPCIIMDFWNKFYVTYTRKWFRNYTNVCIINKLLANFN